MSRDYKPAQQKSGSGGKGNPFLTGLLVGLLLGVVISVGLVMAIKGSDSPFMAKVSPGSKLDNKPVESNADSTAAKDDKSTQDATKDTSGKPRFDFYTILPGSESKVTEQEIQQKQADNSPNKSNESYFLQVGAFQTEQEADNLKAKLALLGLETIVQTATIPDKGLLHRVRVGPFVDLDQISKAKAELVKNGFNADLIKVNASLNNQ